MIVQSYVFDYPLSTRHKGPSSQSLKMTGKKYTTCFSENEGLTLIFAHGVGSRELRRYLGAANLLITDVVCSLFQIKNNGSR